MRLSCLHFSPMSNVSLRAAAQLNAFFLLHSFSSATSASAVYGIEPEPMVFEDAVFSTTNDLSHRPAQLALNVLEAGTDLRAHGLDRRFDLVYSIEVAEHIPQQLHPAMVDFLVAR